MYAEVDLGGAEMKYCVILHTRETQQLYNNLTSFKYLQVL